MSQWRALFCYGCGRHLPMERFVLLIANRRPVCLRCYERIHFAKTHQQHNRSRHQHHARGYARGMIPPWLKRE